MGRQVSSWITHRWGKWPVLVVLVGLLLGLGLAFGTKLSDVQRNEASSFLPADAQSTRVIERASRFADPDVLPAIVLLVRDGGARPQDLQRLVALKSELATVPEVTGDVVGPIPSRDGEAAELVVNLRVDADAGLERLPDAVQELRDLAEKDADGAEVYVAGPAALGADQAQAFAGIDGILLLAAVSVVVVMLLLTYRSPVLWVIPLFCGVLSVFAAQGVVYLLAKHAGLTVNGQSAGILSVLVLGAGIDYALLIVARYREELRNTADRHEAMAHALHRAAPAVLASGSTVVVGLLCLLLAQMQATAGLGPVAAAGIVVALVTMLGLLPVLLVVSGRWVFWPFVPHHGDPQPAEDGVWGRVGRRIAHRPRAVWAVTTLLLAVFTVGLVQLDANGLSDAEQFTTEQPSIVAEGKLAEHFPGGAGSPVQVVVDAAHVDDAAAALQDVRGIAPDSVSRPVVRGDVGYVEGTLEAAPDSRAAFDTIDRARDAMADVPGDPLVGGTTAINHDVQEASAADTRLIIPVVLLAVLLILGVLLRSVMAPIVLLVTVVLSFGAALGISALVFRHLFGFGGTDSSFPLYAFVFLVALGIDYNIFLMTRVREESLVHGTRRGALVGLAATGGVITSAGLVLAGTFAALGSLPIVFLAELGFAVALGVLLDTLVVRSVLVTALTLDLGRWMWWPSALFRTDGGHATSTGHAVTHHVADAAHPAEPVTGHDSPEHRA
ncbi:RND superfamily putative drug exporter [Aeromicrobium sp. SORGH_AS981]|uniref:MMPL family transporter n=1 Tax=Aeromicrobium sp. SORGH_AS_0981 TaxID=3041802 RepID=UPI00285F2568|nr:MMPL family transporter [Aeromicrobium sp. SORGH_AS_0981]MDR6118900.1 RND superfamily putative drug exporter [Aeromicrobium sp. SORGH_AS_0981]